MYKYMEEWPSYSSDPSDILNLDPTKPISVDAEWDALQRPDVLGVSDGTLHVTASWDEAIEYFVHFLKLHPQAIIAGHNFVQADLPLFEQRGIHIPLEHIDDTILWHYLVNMFLCKASGKSALDEENGTELRGRGFMNLGTFSSMFTNFPHWKTCRGEGCTGPCPKHDQLWYNAIDCASVAEGLPKVKAQAKLRGVDKLYPLHRELAWVLAQMRDKGVKINVPYVYSAETHPLGSRDGNSLDEQFQRERERIKELLPFNPHSPKAIVDHFKKWDLSDAQEQTIGDAVEELGEQAPEELKLLLEYKELGNGVGRWFEPEYRNKNGWLEGYLDRDGYVHPRLSPFTSNGRLACSSPNFQNIYVRKGEQIRRAIVAPEGYYLVRADYSNAENRVVLFRSGYQVAREIDLHAWVAEISGLTADMDFVKRVGGGSPRQAAKSVQHACLPGDHEVLTPWGWVPISFWTKGMPIAQWSPTEVTFVVPEARHEYEISEEIQVLRGQGFNQRTTLNHEFYGVSTGTWKDKEYVTWKKDTFDNFSGYIRLPVTGILKVENEIFEDDDIQRAVAIQADASYKNGHFGFHIVKERKKERLQKLFSGEAHSCKCHPGGIHLSGTFRSPLLSPSKQFTNALLSLSQRQRELFLSELLLWDGSSSGYRNVYHNTDLISLCWAQTIAHLSGRQSLLRKVMQESGFEGSKQGYSLSYNNRQFVQKYSLDKSLAHFSGKVFCFTVPSGAFMVRYRGTIGVTGNSNILEGLQLKTPEAMRSKRVVDEIKAGARKVYPNWTFRGKVVSFTGVNLSRRVYGDATYDHRRAALEIQEQYFNRFPDIRKFQQRVSKQCETDGCVKTPSGYVLISLGQDEDRMKIAQGMQQANPIAHLTKLALVRLGGRWERERLMYPVLQAHDEIICYVKDSVDPKVAMGWLQEDMEIEMPEIPGLVIPAEPTYADTWAKSDQKS